MQRLRVNYPCVSINFETIVHSLETVHEDVHWEEQNFDNASPSAVINFEEARELNIEALRRHLLCDLCGEVMRCPCTSLTCLHSYCRSCIEAEGGIHQSCPINGCERSILDRYVSTELSRHPLGLGRSTIIGDRLLAEVIRKLLRNGCEDQETVSFHRWIPNLLEESEAVEDLGSIRIIPVKQHERSMTVDNEEMDIDDKERGQDVPSESANAATGYGDDVHYMTVAVFPFDDEEQLEMDDHYFYVPTMMTTRQLRKHLEDRFEWSVMMLYCRDRQLTGTTLEEMTLGDICEGYWVPSVRDDEHVFMLGYRLEHSSESESM